MTDLNEKLSLLLDDYTDDDSTATLDEVIGDVNLQYRARRYRMIGEATCLVMPSVWPEPFGRTVIEAFSKATPVVASKIGALRQLVDDGRTGWHFEPGNADDLAAKVRLLLDNPGQLAEMRTAARRQFEKQYTAETNYEMLMEIYRRVTGTKHTTEILTAGVS